MREILPIPLLQTPITRADNCHWAIERRPWRRI